MNFINDITEKYNNSVEEIVKLLSNKYKFDYNEAFNILNLENKNNSKNKCITESIILNDNVNERETQPPIEKKKRGRPKKIVTEDDNKPKKKRGRPKKENIVTVSDTDDETIEPVKTPTITEIIQQNQEKHSQDSDDELQEENIEEEIDVEKTTIEGNEYLIDKSGILYSIDAHDKIGVFRNGMVCPLIN
mgnify:CR=1 FL=1|jgi:hypothetical protein|tara:strand:+ start:293 stop:862 length:570 start_codon:yes stop_codon:yes gene_type:complete